MLESLPYLFVLLTFGAVSAAAFVAGQYVLVQIKLRQRVATSGQDQKTTSLLVEGMDSFISRHFDHKRFRIEGPVRAKLRLDLIRAGFFRADAINYYVFIKLAVAVVVPVVSYLLVERFLFGLAWPLKLLLVAFLTFIAIVGPDGYIARRQRLLNTKYRAVFPDLLDLMVVCVDAGLSLEAALDRLAREIAKRNRALGVNLLILGAETRAGRSTVDALGSLAERLGLDEARAFVAMLRQSIELGTDVADALRIFSDEMRDRRLLRVEERANQLPVKMVLPLGVFIFPVILLLILLPIMLKLLTILQ